MPDMSKLRREARRLMRDRSMLENGNLRAGKMRKGSLIEHYKKCGSSACACTKGKLHGPYWYLAYTKAGKSVLAYVRKEDLPGVKRLARSYKSFQANMAKIRKINARINCLLAELRAVRLEQGM